MLQPSDNWSEFDWEGALRESDEFANQYFALLKRFCDLPSANELIVRNMGPDYDQDAFDFDLEMQMSQDEWNTFREVMSGIEEGDGEESKVGDVEDHDPTDDDFLFYETDPVFTSIRQAAIGWCNVYAAILPPEAREQALKVLYYIGRALANLAYSIDDGMYEQPAASIAFAKRSLANLNDAIGTINLLIKDSPRFEKILIAIRNHLVQGVDRVVDHIQKCRQTKGPKA